MTNENYKNHLRDAYSSFYGSVKYIITIPTHFGIQKWNKQERVEQEESLKSKTLFYEVKWESYHRRIFLAAIDTWKENKILGLVSDQDAKSKGIFVNFFDKPASTHTGAAKFHINTGAPMIFGLCIQTGFQKYKIELISVSGTKNNVENITQEFTAILENIIRKYPEQNFWFHNRWKTIPQK